VPSRRVDLTRQSPSHLPRPTFFKKHSINADTHTHTITHPYEHIHAHSTPMSTSKRLSRLDLKIHEVGHQEHLAVDGDVASPTLVVLVFSARNMPSGLSSKPDG
jgi:hypothetical protein